MLFVAIVFNIVRSILKYKPVLVLPLQIHFEMHSLKMCLIISYVNVLYYSYNG